MIKDYLVEEESRKETILKKRFIRVGIWLMVLAVIGASFYVICTTNPKFPTNPKEGWVQVSNTSVSKACDGTTLLYSNGGVVVNSPECQGNQ